MNNRLQSFECSNCGGTPLADDGNGTLSCPYCGAAFAHPERVCSRCEAVNEPDARQCSSCGAKLKEACAQCGTLNWVRAAYCRRCGAALDVLEHIAARRAETTAERLHRLHSEMTPLKEEAEHASQARLEKMWAQERTRLETIAKAQAERRRQERIIWAVAAAAIVVLLIAILALTVIAQLRTP